MEKEQPLPVLEKLARAGVTIEVESAIRVGSANPYPDEQGPFLIDSLKSEKSISIDYSSKSRKGLGIKRFDLSPERVDITLSDSSNYMVCQEHEYFGRHINRSLGQVSMEEYQKMLDRIKG